MRPGFRPASRTAGCCGALVLVERRLDLGDLVASPASVGMPSPLPPCCGDRRTTRRRGRRSRRRSRSPAARPGALALGRRRLADDSFSDGPISISRYRLRPVAAGISLPMITFSLRPSRRSTLPSIAASVSTFVVSWKEAAERKDSVASDAFVIPRISGSYVACSSFFAFLTRTFSRSSTTLVDQLAGQELGVAGVLDADLLQHLPDDQLDVLVVDVDALGLVDLLHLADEVQLGRASSPSSARAARPGSASPRGAGRRARRPRPFVDEQARAPRELVLLRLQRLAVLVERRPGRS